MMADLELVASATKGAVVSDNSNSANTCGAVNGNHDDGEQQHTAATEYAVPTWAPDTRSADQTRLLPRRRPSFSSDMLIAERDIGGVDDLKGHKQISPRKKAKIGIALLCIVVPFIVGAAGLRNQNNHNYGPSPYIIYNEKQLREAVDEYFLNLRMRALTPIGTWDVSRVTSFKALFSEHRNRGAQYFSGDGIRFWDVGKGKNFNFMFHGASRFDADFSSWDTSSATSMRSMFYGARSFRGTGMGQWNVSRVRNMDKMFLEASEFDANLSSWDTSSATSMTNMFANARHFRGTGIGQWNVSRIKNMDKMFQQASEFDANLSSWDTSSATSMTNMFESARSFRGTGMDWWNVSRVKDMLGMFKGAPKFDADLSSWDTSCATSMDWMFYYASEFDSNLSSWDTSGVTSMNQMFENARSFRGEGLANWNVSSVKYMPSMFRRAFNFRSNLCSWREHVNTSTTSAQYMFEETSCPNTRDPNVFPGTPFCYDCAA